MKLKNISLAIIALGVSLMVSCKDEEKNETTPAQTEVDSTNSNTQTTASLNPQHGQPGHRCDIPVGAPLDQAAGNSNTQNTTPASTTTSPVWSNDAAPVKNPPHGQPGHDCAVPVGADLKK
ncbi:hypothetical protein [Gillisia limnaea]|uniref:Secreted protein n=1 Tax=Gillisia limnaea (strain DSM 15749 / LMG 21470 / R-8282) TaxID=865937 RepID=H2BVH4_GILLR|nr:hypothetical protein [Gillisia limnaea]EHQ02882.1 secreted protein [Gillisia limnaea DSM 15749]